MGLGEGRGEGGEVQEAKWAFSLEGERPDTIGEGGGGSALASREDPVISKLVHPTTPTSRGAHLVPLVLSNIAVGVAQSSCILERGSSCLTHGKHEPQGVITGPIGSKCEGKAAKMGP